jgi:CheY-like chemotaxis protein
LSLADSQDGLIHLLLTDLVMPGMSGHELAQRLKILRPAMEIIFISGYAEGVTAEQVAALSGAYLAKPFTADVLASKVREVLGAPRPAATIVVADDEPGVRSFLRKVLTAAGYRVLEANDGKQAVQHVESNGVSLVITDLAMPEQEGIETIRRLRHERPDLKIIAISGQFAGGVLAAARVLGANASLAKPIDPDELLRVVRRLLAG